MERIRIIPKGQSSKVVFKRYDQAQPFLVPSSLEELIPERYAVRVVNAAVERMNIDTLMSSYVGGGASRYHPTTTWTDAGAVSAGVKKFYIVKSDK